MKPNFGVFGSTQSRMELPFKMITGAVAQTQVDTMDTCPALLKSGPPTADTQ